MEKRLCLSSFIIKIIALIAMTLDHIGVFLEMNPNINPGFVLFLRILGRISLPLFIFTTIESISKTKHKEQYLIRLSVAAFLVMIGISIINSPLFDHGINKIPFMNIGNIFIDLLMISLFMYLIENKNKYIKYLSSLPILYLCLSGVIKYLRIEIIPAGTYHFLYDGFLAQYDFIGALIVLFTYIGYYFFNKNCINAFKENPSLYDSFKETSTYQFKRNTIVSISIVIVSIICYLFGRFSILPRLGDYMKLELMSYIVLSIPFIFFYNGKLGKSNKAIKYGFYLYYPLHLLVLFIIFNFIR